MGGRKPKVSDEELLKIIQEQCALRGVPVVPTRVVAEADRVPITHQAVFSRLKQLHEEERIGRIEAQENRTSVWWVPEDEETDTDLSTIAWENVPIEKIPEEEIRDHPAFEEQTYWENRREKAISRVNTGAWGLLIGSLIFTLPGLPLIPASIWQQLELFAAVALVGGIGLCLIAAGEVLIVRVGQMFVDKGYDETVVEARSGVVGWITSKIGYRIVPVSQENTTVSDGKRPPDDATGEHPADG